MTGRVVIRRLALLVSLLALISLGTACASNDSGADQASDGATIATTTTAELPGSAGSTTIDDAVPTGSAEFTDEEGGTWLAEAAIVSDRTVADPASEISERCPTSELPPAGMRFVTMELTLTYTGSRRSGPNDVLLASTVDRETLGVNESLGTFDSFAFVEATDVNKLLSSGIESWDCLPEPVEDDPGGMLGMSDVDPGETATFHELIVLGPAVDPDVALGAYVWQDPAGLGQVTEFGAFIEL